MQKWEYKYLTRRRGVKAPDQDGFSDPTEWSPNIEWAEIELLGEQGWELVAITSLSDYGGRVRSGTWNTGDYDTEIAGLKHGLVNTHGPVVAGMTTSQTFYFKRPKTNVTF